MQIKRVIFIGILVLAQWAWACSGDCLSCHPSLAENILTDERHKPMLTCKTCHENEEAGMSECGKDCFACHDIAKIDKTVREHDVIESCRNCHMNMPVKLEAKQNSSSESNSMYDLLLSPK